jgi:hypothetical protein
MMLDVFKGDAFSLHELTKAVNLLSYQPTRLQRLGWFTEEPLTQTTALIELQGDKLALVPTQPRGAPGVVKGLERRVVRSFQTVHLPQTFSLMADEVMGLRAFGSKTETETAMDRLMRKAAVARRDLDLTIEHQRIGAVKGIVMDADGTTPLLNLFTEFGVTQEVYDMQLDVDATKVHQKHIGLKRLVEDKLGGTVSSGIRILASQEYMDALTGHPAVRDAWRLYQESAKLREDYRAGFEVSPGVIVEEYRGQVGSTRFIPANKAYAVPEGVPDLFVTHYAPANYVETVNTDGLPFYMKTKMLDYDKGIEGEIQSNPLHICTRPNAIIELTI